MPTPDNKVEGVNHPKFIHGMSNRGKPHRLYTIWRSMKARCLNKNTDSYKYYGGKGIKVCESWKNFVAFKEDMYESYVSHVERFGEKDTMIDRIDSNDDYCKKNCRWVTQKEQQQNKPNVGKLSFNGKIQTFPEWDKELGFARGTVRLRIKISGWSVEKTLTTPSLRKRLARNIKE